MDNSKNAPCELSHNEIKRFLNLYKDFHHRAKVKSIEIKNLRLAELPQAIDYTKEKVDHSLSDRMAVYAGKHDQLVRGYNEALEGVLIAHKMIDGIPGGKEQLVLSYFYFENKKNFEIAEEMGYTLDTIKRYKREGIDLIEYNDAEKVRKLLRKYDNA